MKVKSRAESDMARALPERPHGCLLFCSLSVCVGASVLGLDSAVDSLLVDQATGEQTCSGRAMALPLE